MILSDCQRATCVVFCHEVQCKNSSVVTYCRILLRSDLLCVKDYSLLLKQYVRTGIIICTLVSLYIK